MVCEPDAIPRVEALLAAQGFVFEPEPFSGWCRRLVREPLPLGASLAARFGYLHIQDRSSMRARLGLARRQTPSGVAWKMPMGNVSMMRRK